MPIRRIINRFRVRFRAYFILGGVLLLVVTQILFLSPASLEESESGNVLVDPEVLVENQEASLAPGIPQERIPEYSVDQFHYASTRDGQKQWQLYAKRAYLYSKEKLVHAREIRALLYDPEGNATVVVGKEAKYFMNARDLEIFGSVDTQFPDGFETHSDYLRYLPAQRKIVIPSNYFVTGGDMSPPTSPPAEKIASSEPADDQRLSFESFGLIYTMEDGKIMLPQQVKVHTDRTRPPSAYPDDMSAGVPERTTIESDHCAIYRNRRFAHFTMSQERPLKDRFVKIRQPDLLTRARRADLNYGDFSSILQYLVAYEDVLIRDISEPKPGGTSGTALSSMKYATGGKAEFDSRRDLITLREYPQVYQDEDTVTGEVIIVHRDSDIIEVEYSNAFTERDQ